MASNKNLVGAAFEKEFFMGKSGFLAGAAVTVGTTAADYYLINPLEKSLQDKNSDIITNLSLRNSGTGKKIISQSS